VQVALALAEPHVEHVVEPEREEARAELAGHRAREERLAAARRAVQQQAAAQRLAVVGAQLGVAQRGEERGVQARLDLLGAADVGQRDARPGRLLELVELCCVRVVERGVVLRLVARMAAGRRHPLAAHRRRRAASEPAEQAAVLVGACGVAEGTGRVARSGERLDAGGRRGEGGLGVLERPPRVAADDEQRGEVQPQRGVARIGGDRALQRGGHRRIDAHP
jgi:hypothetical protein